MTHREAIIVGCDIAKAAHRLAQRFVRMGDKVHAKVARDTRDINLRAARQRMAIFSKE